MTIFSLFPGLLAKLRISRLQKQIVEMDELYNSCNRVAYNAWYEAKKLRAQLKKIQEEK